MKGLIVFFVLLSVYTIYTLVLIVRVWSPNHLSNVQKILNSILLIVIPFIWGIAVHKALSYKRKGTNSKNRKRKNDWYSFGDHANSV